LPFVTVCAARYTRLRTNSAKPLPNITLSSESKNRMDAMTSLAQSELPVHPDQFDKNRSLLNCKN